MDIEFVLSRVKSIFFPPISVPFLKYLAKISFNRKMTRLVCSPWFNNFPRNDFWMIFRMFLLQKNWGGGGGGGIEKFGKYEVLDLRVVEN